jgi:hypothetical protein
MEHKMKRRILAPREALYGGMGRKRHHNSIPLNKSTSHETEAENVIIGI